MLLYCKLHLKALCLIQLSSLSFNQTLGNFSQSDFNPTSSHPYQNCLYFFLNECHALY